MIIYYIYIYTSPPPQEEVLPKLQVPYGISLQFLSGFPNGSNSELESWNLQRSFIALIIFPFMSKLKISQISNNLFKLYNSGEEDWVDECELWTSGEWTETQPNYLKPNELLQFDPKYVHVCVRACVCVCAFKWSYYYYMNLNNNKFASA